MKLATIQGCGGAQLGPAALCGVEVASLGQTSPNTLEPPELCSLLCLPSPVASLEMPKEASLRDELQF